MSEQPDIVVTAPAGYDRTKLLVELERDEACKLRVYRDNAKPPRRTIGIGRNLDANGISPAETRLLGITVASCVANGITRPQAIVLALNDIAHAEHSLDMHLPWWRRLDPVRQRVLLNMAFNMGADSPGHGLLGFTGTLAKIERHDWSGAVAGMKASAWHDQVGARALRLEAMMLTGKDAA